MERHVQTVLGPVSVAELGMTLPHEHLVFGMTGWEYDLAEPPTHGQQFDACRHQVEASFAAGVRTIVEVSPPEMGRNVPMMQEVAKSTGMHIVCCTGLYARRPTAYFLRRSADEIAELFVHELTEHIGDTEARAGIIKCAVDGPNFTAHERTVLEAAAAAQRETDAPLMVHVEPGASLATARLLNELGVPGHKAVIAHAESDSDLDVLLEIAGDLGMFVGFDRFGYEVTVRNDVRLALVAALCHLGHEDRILLSHDFPCVLHGRDVNRWAGMEDKLTHWGFTYVPQEVLPGLRELAVTDAQIEQMTITNPAMLLGCSASQR